MRRSRRWLLGWVGLLGLCCVFVLGALAPLAPVVAQAEATPTPQTPEEPVVHVVKAGETLLGIAQRYGVTVEAIVAANGLVDPGRIVVDQELVIPAAAAGSGETSSGESGAPSYQVYLVLPDDTLNVVARRFGTSATALATLNGVVNPARLPLGAELQVPARQAGRLHPVSEGETALALAVRYGLPAWELLANNHLASAAALLPGQRMIVPGEVVTGTLPVPLLALDVGPLPVSQGRSVRVRVELAAEAQIEGVFEDQALNFAVEGEARYALFGVHALDDPGFYPLALLATDAAGDEVYWLQSIQVVDGGYAYEEIILPPERDELLDPEALAAERARIAEVKSVFNPERYWDGLFTRPLDTELTSAFGTRRLYQSPSYRYYGYHEGTDFNGEVGTPVYAPAAGVVVLAEPLFVRGNALVIDHGWGIYTGYWHLSQIDVTVGQRVAPGDQIALVGDTGLSTGPHLHWDFWVNGTNVSALQWTEQTFP